MKSTVHTNLCAISSQFVFGYAAMLNDSFQADWQFAGERKQRLVFQNNKHENAKRTPHAHNVGDVEAVIDKGVGFKPGSDNKRIRVHMVCAVKHDDQHKARLVAGAHLATTPVDSVHSGIFSLRGVTILAFLGELNGLKVWSTDIGNTCLEMHTKEKVHIVAGPQCGDQEGHVLITSKALYSLHSSSLRWSEQLANALRAMGFLPSKAEKDMWMHDKGDHYKHIAVCVDHLMFTSHHPDVIIKALVDKHKFKLKATGPTEFYLGCDFFCDEEGALCCTPKKCVLKILDNCCWIYGT